MLFFILVAIAHANELHYLGLKNYSMIKKENSPIVIFYYGEDRNSKKFLPEFLLIADKKHELVNQSTTFPETLNYGIVN
jgi:protein disulfide-isomerase A1